MKKGWKILFVSCGVLAAAGIILSAAGAAMGGSVSDVARVFAKEQRARYNTGESGISDAADDTVTASETAGHHSEEDSSEHHAEENVTGHQTGGDTGAVYCTEYRGIRELSVDISYVYLEISEYEGDCVRVTAEGFPEESVWNDVVFEQDGSELDIELRDLSEWRRLFANNTTGVVTVQIPADSLSEADITIDAGVLNVSGLHVGELDIEIGAGEATVKDFTANEMSLQCDTGSVDISGDARDSSVECGIGEVTYEAAGRKDDYHYEIECGIGDVTVGDSSYSGLGGEKKIQNPGAVRSIEIECGIGTVSVIFEDR